MSESLIALQEWLLDAADGEWEHGPGITIATLDNPGWYMTVSLAGSPLEGRQLAYAKFRDDEPTWVHCWSTGETFEAAAGPRGLSYAIEEFLAFAGPAAKPNRKR